MRSEYRPQAFRTWTTGASGLAAVFHCWEKSVYPVIETRVQGPAQVLRYILSLDRFFHIMLTTAMTTFMRLDSEHQPFDSIVALTPRQQEILTLLAEGQSNKKIASSLGVSTRTVEGHRHRLMHRIGATNTAELIRFGYRSGIVQP